ncbi:MAG: TonB-dependent receptor [Acidobacteria bacterium]|nr:TonB-dependent receptor [Acidobacteriota bacterium]
MTFRFPAVAVLSTLLLAPPFFDAALMGAGNLPDEEVVVTANASPVPFGNLSRSVAVLTREDIARLPVHSIPDILAHAGADVGARAPSGMQADIRLRGSSFSQVLVLVDGVRLNDSQTGHHNADIPVPMEDIERIEVLLGPGSSIYGADAFGGTVHIITRAPAPGVRAAVGAGAHGFAEGSLSAGFEKGTLRQSFSVTAGRSSGFRHDRDFRAVTFAARSQIGKSTTLAVSHADREFGADGFYGPAPSREWTNQTLVSLSRSHGIARGVHADFRGWYRTHGDRFLYDVRTPGLFESRHRTHAAGASARARVPLGDAAALTLGGEAGADWIASGTLGDHSFSRSSLSAELEWSAPKRAAVYPGIRFDHYSNFGSAVSPSLSASLWATPRIRLRSSIGRAFRIPTFTELHYRDPNHEASPRLGPERAWSAELGADFIPAADWLGSLTLFSRRETDVIDWVRSTPGEKWRTANIRRLRTGGIEIGLRHALGPHAGLETRYSLIVSDAGSVDYVSKYVLDYARHGWVSAAHFPLPLGLRSRQSLGYKRRADGRGYWILDGAVERVFPHFILGVEGTNLLDNAYQEIRGVDMPGRWLGISVRPR